MSRSVELGQTVAAASPPLFVIAADRAIVHIAANVSAKDIGDVKLGEKVTFTVEAFPNRTFAGTMTQIRPSPQSDERAATYDVVISATQSGSFAQARYAGNNQDRDRVMR